MESSKESKECKQFGHVGPLRIGSYSLVCDHCNELLAGSIPITVKQLQDMLAPPHPNRGEKQDG